METSVSQGALQAGHPEASAPLAGSRDRAVRTPRAEHLPQAVGPTHAANCSLGSARTRVAMTMT